MGGSGATDALPSSWSTNSGPLPKPRRRKWGVEAPDPAVATIRAGVRTMPLQIQAGGCWLQLE
ncbi:hypothetical protein E2562_024653 [Oryza meyeriana var. granulata]|uniref:Uncharacterized protein n=1 Tax=Oryza meyeriana var. granulata TaxID=110450 RepID=A0A6G1EBC0_9ORYZ|nr:hypothetical protein E2562_024653 [Oryza meyeriana var. granulata]